jgi:y4mF family transcriptional regulator
MAQRIEDSDALGRAIRDRRKSLGLTGAELAVAANTSHRFLSELENGKPTARIAGVFRVLAALGLDIDLTQR